MDSRTIDSVKQNPLPCRFDKATFGIFIHTSRPENGCAEWDH